ncbi:NAD(P)H-binding protein [Loigolactobacillus jiayinensis]|uniref:NAD(P)H-binding protein n=1 Tax=Loigolactobacillus jiayinensis TaxID=2486016 RepID=A0ABW1RDI2_9LACO|nr:NAD(P)H-binding protein [Loigolactobacillus jiayinensis]
MKYAITGATGKFGTSALQALAKLVPATDIVALARNVEKAQQSVPAGVEVRPGDYTDVATLTTSLSGIDKLLFVSSQPGAAMPREQQHLNVVQAAKKAGVSYIAYTSFPKADKSQTPLAADHQATEQAISAAGLAHSFLRNNWYLENELGTIKPALAGQPFIYSAAAGRAGWALEREYAAAAAKVLVTEQPAPIYEFAGAARTYQDLATATAQLTNQKFDVLSINDAEYKQKLSASGLPAAVAGFKAMGQALIREGNLDEETTALATVLGHDLQPLPAAISEITK